MRTRSKEITDSQELAPIYLQLESEELRAQLETVAAASGISSLSEMTSHSTISAVFVDLESLPRGRWQHPGIPTLLVGNEEEEGELWLAAANLGIDRVVPLPKAAQWLAEFLSGLHSERCRGQLVSVVGGCGGAGASTLSALLGVQLNRQGNSCLLIDADSWGAGIEYSLSSEPMSGLSWQDLAASVGSLNPGQFASALPEVAACRVLGFGTVGRSGKESLIKVRQRTAATTIDAARRGFNIVLADTGRSMEPLDVFTSQADVILCILPATVTAMLATRRLLRTLATDRLFLVVRGPMPEGLDAELIAESLGVPLLGSLAAMRGIAANAEQGALPSFAEHRSVRRLSTALLAVLEERKR